MSDPTSDTQVAYATIGLRFAARFIDGLIVAVPLAVFFGIALAAGGGEVRPGLLQVGSITVAMAYEVVLTARTGQTVGKRLLKIRVVALDGSPCGFRRSLIRCGFPTAAQYGASFVVPRAAILVTPLIYLFAVLDPDKQGLHDKAAGTIVVTA